jgi:uncharacterized RDD family membrane protein YckC
MKRVPQMSAQAPKNQELQTAAPLRRSIAKLIDVGVFSVLSFFVLREYAFLLAGTLVLFCDLVPRGSVGKRLVGLALVSADGSPPSIFAKFLRNVPFVIASLFSLISVWGGIIGAILVWGIEGILAFLHPDGLRVGDLLAKTRVIESEGDEGSDNSSFTRPDV